MYEITIEPLIECFRNFKPDQAVAMLRDVLHAEAEILGIVPTAINVSTAINVADGGIDAEVNTNLSTQASFTGLIFNGLTRYQIKTEKKTDINALLFKPKKRGQGKKLPEDLMDRVKTCLDKGGTFVAILFGSDNPDPTDDSTKNKILEELTKVDSKYEDAKIEIVFPNQLAMILERYFPGKALELKGVRFPSHVHDIEYVGSCCNLDGKDNYIVTDEIKSTCETIKQKLIAPPGLIHIRIIGEPGLGKTRLIYETIKQTKLGPITLYSNDPKNLFDQGVMHDIFNLSKKSPLIFIIDECDYAYREEIHTLFKNSQKPIILITIYNEFENQDSKKPYLLFQPPLLSESEIKKILKSYSLSDELCSHIAHLCSGSPRVAHIVGQHLQANPGSTSLTDLDGLKDIWNAYIAGKSHITSEDYRLQHMVLKFLALFRKFGYEDGSTDLKQIHILIQTVESSLSVDKFNKIIKQLRDRRILQGNTTLYITPKLLQIKLWCDWWDNYEEYYDIIKQVLNNLTEQLRAWFFEMFAYTRASKVAENVVERLLSKEGLFYKLDNYTEEGSNFFLILSKVNPKLAIRAIKSTLEEKNHSELIEFKIGRQLIIHALEQIALYEEYFEDAAECLLLLAEAENEGWTNNATGVFTGLFTLGCGKASPTNLPPIERLSFLTKHINSPNPKIRELVLESFNKALSSHFHRWDIRIPTGLQPAPSGWVPKVQEELNEAYKYYLSALWDIRENLTDKNDRNKAAEIILNHAPSLIFIDLLRDTLISIFEILSKESDTSHLTNTIVRILYQYKDSKKENFLQNLEKLHVDLTESSYASKLKRYISRDLFEDRYEAEPENHVHTKLKILAEEALENPSLIKPEFDWLTKQQTQNAYEFGEFLATKDKASSFWEPIYTSWLSSFPDTSETFIGGYLSGIFKKDSKKWESLIVQVSQENGHSKILSLVFRSGMTPEISKLLLLQADKKSFDPSEFYVLTYNSILKDFPKDILLNIFKLLLKTETKKSILTALRLMYCIISNKFIPIEEVFFVCLKIISHSTFFKPVDKKPMDTMTDFYWKELALYSAKYNLDDTLFLLEICLENFDEEGSLFSTYQAQCFEFINFCLKNKPQHFWACISKFIEPPVESKGLQIMLWLKSNFEQETGSNVANFYLLCEEEIIQWIEDKPETRAPLIARFIPASLIQFDINTSKIIRVLLEKHGDKKNVLNTLSASFHTESWQGLKSTHYQEKLSKINTALQTEVNRNIRSWLNEEKEKLEKMIAQALINEERYGY